MKRFYLQAFVFFTFSIGLTSSLLADENTAIESSAPAQPRFIVTQLWDDVHYLTTQPDFYFVTGGLALAPVVLSSDLARESGRWSALWGNSPAADRFFEFGEIAGDAAFPVALSTTSWAFGKVAGRRRFREFGSDLFRAQAINGLLTGLMKVGINRTRPDGSAYSFPSGHTSSAFTTAGVVYKHFGPHWGIPAYLLAGYVGVSRLQENKHYLSDIIAGGVLGSYIGYKIARHPEVSGGVKLGPYFHNGGIGLKIKYRF